MATQATTPDLYVASLDGDRKEAIEKLRTVIKKSLPKGYEECINYGMLGYVVPHTIFPSGYHCDPKLPLPFVALASQKNAISFYHMGIYTQPDLLTWFEQEYPKHSKAKLDMGKSCIRFKKMDQIPYDLIGELCKKITVKDWIAIYEKNLKK